MIYNHPPRRCVKGRWKIKLRWYSRELGRYEHRMAESGNRRRLLDGKWHVMVPPYRMRNLGRRLS